MQKYVYEKVTKILNGKLNYVEKWAKLCKTKQKYAHQKMHSSVDIFEKILKSIHKYAKVFQGILKYSLWQHLYYSH